MKHVAAYLLCYLGGNTSPDAAAISAVIAAGGGEADSAAIELLLSEMGGKVRDWRPGDL
jgi:large subunit ribosomal protein LP2